MEIHRYKVTIEYVGTGFVGWQKQANGLSVQQTLEDAIFNLTKQVVTVHGAGRTDTGVHALGQVAHFDLATLHDPYRLGQSLNYFMIPHLVGITNCEIVTVDFHARFSACQRHYLYKIVNRTSKVILDDKRVWWVKPKLDVDAMREGAQYLIGKHDFTSYRAKHCQSASPVKTLKKLEIVEVGNEQIHFYLSAQSFLHHMVRNIIGSLSMVGIGKWPCEQIKTALEARKRDAAGLTAPAEGLYFLKVDYD